MIDGPDVNETIHGPYGHVDPIPLPDPDEAGLSEAASAALRVCVCTYLVTAPGWHPLWSQYALSVVNLRDAPDLPPAVRTLPDATHELLVLALNPEPGPQTVETMTDHCRTGRLPFMQPVNVAAQFIATDEEMHAVAWLAARATVFGGLAPEPPFGYESFRATWLAVCTRTLAHLRGEAHAH